MSGGMDAGKEFEPKKPDQFVIALQQAVLANTVKIAAQKAYEAASKAMSKSLDTFHKMMQNLNTEYCKCQEAQNATDCDAKVYLKYNNKLYEVYHDFNNEVQFKEAKVVILE